MASGDTAVETAKKDIFFGPWKLHPEEVFLETELSIAIVNFKPVVPGHVLIISRRVVPRFGDLSSEEASDLWLTAQRVAKKVEPFFGCTSSTFAIQDGPEAGQTVPHVHIHILPRKSGDFKKNDEIYDEIEKNEQDLKRQRMDEEDSRKPRSKEEMAEEANKLSQLFTDK